jgi:hypothetical protein
VTEPDPAPTRQSLHTVAEHVLGAALHAKTGRIGLRVTPNGFGTPFFEGPDGPRRIRVDGTDLVVEDRDEQGRRPLTTIRAAADLAGVAPGAPSEVYTPATLIELDRPLTIDPESAARLADFFAVVESALVQLRTRHQGEEPSEVQLWPEHFDLAATIGEVNFGGSPGDDDHRLPYLYVGPWSRPGDGDPFWNEPFGASAPADPSLDAEMALGFYESGRAHLGL